MKYFTNNKSIQFQFIKQFLHGYIVDRSSLELFDLGAAQVLNILISLSSIGAGSL